MQVIDLTEEDGALEAEQIILDKHDDDIADLTVRLQHLMNSTSSVPTVANDRERRSLSLKFSRLERGLRAIDEAVSALPEGATEISLIQQHQEQLSDYNCKKDLAVLYSAPRHVVTFYIKKGFY